MHFKRFLSAILEEQNKFLENKKEHILMHLFNSVHFKASGDKEYKKTFSYLHIIDLIRLSLEPHIFYLASREAVVV